MKRNLRLLAWYLVGVLLLSSVDITYEWFSPLTLDDGTTVKWYGFVGLRGGAVGTGNNETGPATALSLSLHAPKLIPLPFYAGGGPEGGGIFVSIWFLGLVVWSAHALFRTRSGRSVRRGGGGA